MREMQNKKALLRAFLLNLIISPSSSVILQLLDKCRVTDGRERLDGFVFFAQQVIAVLVIQEYRSLIVAEEFHNLIQVLFERPIEIQFTVLKLIMESIIFVIA